MAFLEHYLAIQKIRFATTCDRDANRAGGEICFRTLPFRSATVENAIRHEFQAAGERYRVGTPGRNRLTFVCSTTAWTSGGGRLRTPAALGFP